MLVRSPLLFAGVLLCAVAVSGQSQTPDASATAPPVSTAPAAAPAPMGQIVVPVNTTIPLELRNTLTSRTAYAGQAIYCITIYPITVNNRIVIPVGSYVKGRITQVVQPGRVKGKAQIGLRFEEITLPSGVTKPLRASLSGFGGNGREGFSRKEGKIRGESSKGKDAESVAITAAEGAGIGSIAGISGGHSGAGAGIGGAAGALGGLVYVLATRGKELVLAQGTNLELELAAPLSFYRDEIDSSSTGPAGPALGRRDPGPGL
jgi:hypothetical protein